jgi:GMP synthase-like glutamine amidotransferase
MKILIVDNGSKYLSKLQSLTSAHDVTTKKYTEIDVRAGNNYDLIILSGGHTFSVVGHEAEFEREINLIKNSTTPILGICLGFELIAYSYGATLIQLTDREKGVLHIEKITPDPIFGHLSDLQVFESHRWIVTDVGAQILPLAGSVDGIEIIKHKVKLIYGFQFHPEMFRDQTRGGELFANLIKIVQNNYL